MFPSQAMLAAAAAFALALAATTASAQVRPAPDGTPLCVDTGKSVFDEDDGPLTNFKWCNYSATEAQRDKYTRPNMGAPWINVPPSFLFLCSDQNNRNYIKSRPWKGGHTGDYVLSQLCPSS